MIEVSIVFFIFLSKVKHMLTYLWIELISFIVLFKSLEPTNVVMGMRNKMDCEKGFVVKRRLKCFRIAST